MKNTILDERMKQLNSRGKDKIILLWIKEKKNAIVDEIIKY